MNKLIIQNKKYSKNVVFAVLLAVITVFFIGAISVHAATTGVVYPTLGTTAAENPWLDDDWVTPTNIYSNDAATANITASTFDTNDQSYVLKATGFDFSSIPDGSYIEGVTLSANTWYTSGQGSGSIDLCQLLDVSRARVGTNLCSTPIALSTGTGSIVTVGSTTELWGNALTTSWLKDSDFGIGLGVLSTAANTDVDVDFVRLNVSYSVGTNLGAATSTDPIAIIIAPGSAATTTDTFTFNTSSSTDVITAVRVAHTNASSTSLIEIVSNDGATVYGSTTNPTGTSTNISLSMNTLTATTGVTTYKIRVTPKSQSNLPSGSKGQLISISTNIVSWTGTNGQVGNDTSFPMIIDNQSLSNFGISGSQSFANKMDYTVGNGSRDVANADLDNDGDIDLVVSNGNSSNTSVLLNNGNGTFATKVDYNTSSFPMSVTAADLDNDGDVDLAFAGAYASVLLNNGNGTFATKVDYTIGSNAWSITAADLDNDGDIDLITVDSTDNNASVLLNNGNGTFATKVDYTTATNPKHITAADFDNDGDIDLATANYGSANASVLLNNGNGTFATKVDYTTATNAYHVTAADFNNDGYLDLAVVNSGAASVSILFNNGNGTFATKVDYTIGSNPWSVTAADFDNDGDIDLATANYDSANASVLLNNGNGTFATKVDYTTAVSPSNITAADLNNDGNVDFVTTSWGSTNTSIFLNNSSSTLTTEVGIESGESTISYTTPPSDDLNSIVILRSTSAITDVPVDGTSYTGGETIGSATVACVDTTVSISTADSCTATGLTNGTSYHLKVFVKDNFGNYSVGSIPTGSPVIPTNPPSAWNATDWTLYDTITIDATKVNATLTDFPVYVDLSDLSDSFWATTPTGAATVGTDIRVTTNDGSPVELPRELVSASSTAQTGELHFKANSISSTTDTVFRIYYNGTTTGDYHVSSTYGAENVWSNGYVAVYHAKNASDSTSYDMDLSVSGNATSSTGGKLGSTFAFDGTGDYLSRSDFSSFASKTKYTISAWSNLNTIGTNSDVDDGMIFSYGDVDPGADLLWYNVNTTGTLADHKYSFNAGLASVSANRVNSATAAVASRWTYVSSVRDVTTRDIYIDGVFDAGVTGATSTLNDSYSDLRIGGRSDNSNYDFDGSIDELRVSSTTRSAAWISAEYTNQSITTDFYSVNNRQIDTFSSATSTQTWTVPAGVTSITVKTWGAGGGGAGGGTVSIGGNGGGAGFAQGTISVTPGETLNLRVGGKGGKGDFSTGTGGALGGDGGGGGGYTAILRGSTVLVLAAGGAGGGGGDNSSATAGGAGGIGGSSTGGTGGTSGTATGGSGGTPSAGGAGGTGGVNTGGAGSSLQGGAGGKGDDAATGTGGKGNQGLNGGGDAGMGDDGCNGCGGGGGGGGGYYGGGGGASSAAGNAGGGGGGGGSNFIISTAIATSSTAGSDRIAANTSDPDYLGTSGYGGVSGGTSASGNDGSDGLLVLSWTAASEWNAADWTLYDVITIDEENIDEALIDFPVYVNLSDMSAQFWSTISDYGSDIRVTTNEASPVELPREIVSASTTTETGEMHFKAPRISDTIDTSFRIYYNGSTAGDYATDDTYGAQNVWTNGYVGVWHLGDGDSTASGFYKDSTNNENNGTLTDSDGDTAQSTGKLGKSVDFEGDDDFINTQIDWGTDKSEVTVSFWNNVEASERKASSAFGNITGNERFSAHVPYSTSGTVYWDYGTCCATGRVSTAAGGYDSYDDKWSYLNFIYQTTPSTYRAIYADGLVLTSNTSADEPDVSFTDFYIGNENGGSTGAHRGDIDEFRLSSAARSAAWIKAEYYNQSTTTDFYTLTTGSGSSTISNSDAGQVSDAFSSQNKTNESLFAFRITPNSGDATITKLELSLLGAKNINVTDFSNIRLYRDMDNDGAYDATDAQVGGAGVMTLNYGYSSQQGKIAFTSAFQSTTTQNYLVVADWNAPINGSFLTIELKPGSISAYDNNGAVVFDGSVSSIQHSRNNRGGGGSSAQVGGAPPAGDGDVGGGSDEGGELIGDDPDFFWPSAQSGSWTNAANAYDRTDGTYATAATAVTNNFSNYGFVVSGNRIDGIEVKLETSGTTAAGNITAQLSWDGGTTWTTGKNTPTLTTADAVITLGSTSDTWGRAWTASEFSTANFAVRLTGGPSSNTVRVDALQVRVYHTTTGGGGGGGGGGI